MMLADKAMNQDLYLYWSFSKEVSARLTPFLSCEKMVKSFLFRLREDIDAVMDILRDR